MCIYTVGSLWGAWTSVLILDLKLYAQLQDTTVLRPHSFVANLDVWCYYLENHISQFLPYDPEFISHRNLTLSDIHHKFFNTPRTWESLVPADSQFIPLVKLIHQCVDVTNEIYVIKGLPLVVWYELLQDFEHKMKNGASLQVYMCMYITACVCVCVCMQGRLRRWGWWGQSPTTFCWPLNFI